MSRRWCRKHLATIILSVLFVVLFALYLYSSADVAPQRQTEVPERTGVRVEEPIRPVPR